MNANGDVITYTVKWKRVSCTQNHSIALDTSGNIWTCGNNTQGELGLGNTGGYRSYFQKNN